MLWPWPCLDQSQNLNQFICVDWLAQPFHCLLIILLLHNLCMTCNCDNEQLMKAQLEHLLLALFLTQYLNLVTKPYQRNWSTGVSQGLFKSVPGICQCVPGTPAWLHCWPLAQNPGPLSHEHMGLFHIVLIWALTLVMHFFEVLSTWEGSFTDDAREQRQLL